MHLAKLFFVSKSSGQIIGNEFLLDESRLGACG
jgi:hypothetical protein